MKKKPPPQNIGFDNPMLHPISRGFGPPDEWYKRHQPMVIRLPSGLIVGLPAT